MLTTRRAASAIFGCLILLIGAPALGQDVGTLPDAAEVMKRASTKAGFAVVVGATDPGLAVGLAKTGRFAVVAVAPDGKARDAWRTAAIDAEVGLPLLVETADVLPGLPCWSGQVDLLVVDFTTLAEKQKPGEDEIKRVLAPGGAALVRRQKTWDVVRPPDDPRLGDWTQTFCDATRNPVSNDSAAGAPTGVRWISGPRTTSSADPFRVAGPIAVTEMPARIVATGLQALPGVRVSNPDQFYTARLAHNGVPLWNSRDDGPRARPLAGMGKRQPWLISGDEILTADVDSGKLTALSLADGKVRRTFDDFPECKQRDLYDLVADGDRVLISSGSRLVLASKTTGKILWEKEAANEHGWYLPVLAKDLALAVEGELPQTKGFQGRITTLGLSTRYPIFPCRSVVAFDLKTGKETWRWQNPGHEFEPNILSITQLLVSGDGVYLFRTTGQSGDIDRCYWLARLDLADGKQRWRVIPESAEPVVSPTGEKRLRHKDGALYKMGVVGDRLFLMGIAHMERDARTGAIVRHFAKGNTQCPGPAFCQTLIARGAGYYFDLKEPDLPVTHSWITRGPCGSNTYIARGLVFYPPSNCSCYRIMYGLMALHSDPAPAELAASSRLERGEEKVASRPADPRDWPTFLGTPRRSSETAARLPGKVALLWKKPIRAVPKPDTPLVQEYLISGGWNGPVSAPTAADGTVFVADAIQGAVIALDADTGEVRWRHAASARIDAPPTWHDGLALFGDDAGNVTALNAATGKLAWRYHVPRSSRAMIAEGRPASAWPVCGAILVQDGLAIAAAGRHADADGGIRVAALDVRTGELRWKQDVGDAPGQWHKFGSEGHLGGKTPSRPGAGDKDPTEVSGGLCFSAGPGMVGIPGMIFHAADGRPILSFFFKAIGLYSALRKIDPDAKDVPWLIDFAARPPTVNQLGNHSMGTGDRAPICIVRKLPTDKLPDPLPRRLTPTAGRTQMIAEGTGLMASTDTRFVRAYLRGKVMIEALDWAKGNKEVAWSIESEKLLPLALCIAGDEVIVAGTTAAPNPDLPYEPLPGAVLRLKLSDGSIIERIELPSAPVQHGIAVARGRIYVTGQDGAVICLGPRDS